MEENNEEITKLKVFKAASNMAVGLGVSRIIRETITSNVPEPETVGGRFLIRAGAFGLALTANHYVSKVVNNTIDEFVDSWQKAKKRLDETEL